MGIDMDPDLDETIPACAAVFPDGAPEIIWASVSGIMPGSLFNPAVHPAAPNRLFPLAHVNLCTWLYSDPNWTVDLFLREVEALFFIFFNPGLIDVFLGIVHVANKFLFTNDIQEQLNNIYYSGQAQMAFTQTGGSPSLGNITELLNVTRTPDCNMDFWADDEIYLGARIVKKSENTNILIKYDQT